MRALEVPIALHLLEHGCRWARQCLRFRNTADQRRPLCVYRQAPVADRAQYWRVSVANHQFPGVSAADPGDVARVTSRPLRAATSEPLLEVRDLVTEFATPGGVVHAVNHASYAVYPGETLAVVGESGSGKSVSVLSILGLIPQPQGKIVHGQVLFEGRDLLQLAASELRRVRGRQIGMIFQDPVSSLNPVHTVGWQIGEALRAHDPRVGRKVARSRSVALLRKVGIPDPDRRVDQYPHEYSGGMCQRAMIAIAIANNPKVLIADEPTTALDVTIQAQVFQVLKVARRETDAAMILITHDLGVVAEMADHMVVMYAGRVVESGTVRQVFENPRHPYTLGLLGSQPRLGARSERLVPIQGQPPSLSHIPTGCAFHPRCNLSRGRQACQQTIPPLVAASDPDGHVSACHFSSEMDAERRRVEGELGGALAGGQR